MSDRIPRTKVQLLRTLSLRADVSQLAAGRVLAELVRLALAGAARPRGFSIPGLGKVLVSRHAARTGWNVHTGRRISIPAKPFPRFVFSRKAAAAIAASAGPAPAPPAPAPKKPAAARAPRAGAAGKTATRKTAR